MNKGKICVSVGAETAGEFIENIKCAEKFADVIELRFDCLQKDEIREVFENLPATEKYFLATFRPKEQGGKRDLSIGERLEFWQFFFSNNKKRDFYIDLEIDLQLILKLDSNKIIVSYHDFSSNPDNLTPAFDLLENLIEPGGKIAKVAIQTNEIAAAVAVWKLLEKAGAESKRIIPIAMGETGKWTRILGLAHGAFMTYAALETGKETASGQISVQDLIETYRVKELNERTEIYGIVGNPVAHSLSPFMHNAAFKFCNLNAVYIPFEAKNLAEFFAKFIIKETREVELNFRGFSVTIPHKKAIVEFLDFTDETAQAVGAVNTVKIEDGKLFGFNTDAAGFIEPLKNHFGDLNGAKIAILGAGGAARACIYALKKEKANITIFARNAERAESLAEEFKAQSAKLKTRNESYANFDILVNTTPLGTKGELENETPAVAAQIENVKLVYDLVYNPFETRFLKEARKANVPFIGGLAMLVAQATKQFEIWTGEKAPVKEMNAAALKKIVN